MKHILLHILRRTMSRWRVHGRHAPRAGSRTKRRAVVLCAVGMLAGWAGAVADPVVVTPAVSATPDPVVRRIPIVSKTEGPMEICVARTAVKLPQAVVLVGVSSGETKSLFTDTSWLNFVEANRLAFATVTVPSETDKLARKGEAGSRLTPEAQVLMALDSMYAKDTPVFLYARPPRAALAERIFALNPKRVPAWCIDSPPLPLHVEKMSGAGVLVARKEDKIIYKQAQGEFEAGRKRQNNLTWISLPGKEPKKESTAALEGFVRDYFAAVLKSRPSYAQWTDIETKQAMSLVESNTRPLSASYLPDGALTPAWAALHVPGTAAASEQAIIEREVDTFNKAQPKLHFYLRKPLSAAADGRVEGVLAFCTWEKERGTLIKKLSDARSPFVTYAEEHRLALLTWDTAKAWSISESADERSRQENYTDDLGFDKLADAWERGVHVLCYENGLPENDYLLFGISRGAQWAHRLALRKPEHFLAVHVHINSSYDWPTPAAKRILWLSTTGEREAGYTAAIRFYARCREMGYPIVFKAGENLGHSSSPAIDTLGRRFFDYALGFRARRDAALAAQGSALGKAAALDTYSLSGLDAAPYYADMINQEVYPAGQEDLIPESQRVPLPNKEMAKAWGEMTDAPELLLVSNSPKSGTASATTSRPEPVVQGKPTHPTPGGAPPSAGGGGTGPQAAVATAPAPQPTPTAVAVAGNPSPQAAPAGSPAGPSLERLDALLRQEAIPAKGDAGDRLRASKVPSSPEWAAQVARILREYMSASPEFKIKFDRAMESAVTRHPPLVEAHSALNTAFMAEYTRLKATGDPLLRDPSWPEQIARAMSEKAQRP